MSCVARAEGVGWMERLMARWLDEPPRFRHGARRERVRGATGSAGPMAYRSRSSLTSFSPPARFTLREVLSWIFVIDISQGT